ncbi:hypothetical protein B0H66DRAFT_287275 [Apodospora peruviana]|uniref:Uncharacterized protein n=1 Tax=Apodospora peruviana TaxID=516989 RepID=A0AAE0M369_9PEZI|nr:hypothetical protein B0H66DRAFT_287275 [Apodospora peruviana]
MLLAGLATACCSYPTKSLVSHTIDYQCLHTTTITITPYGDNCIAHLPKTKFWIINLPKMSYDLRNPQISAATRISGTEGTQQIRQRQDIISRGAFESVCINVTRKSRHGVCFDSIKHPLSNQNQVKWAQRYACQNKKKVEFINSKVSFSQYHAAATIKPHTHYILHVFTSLWSQNPNSMLRKTNNKKTPSIFSFLLISSARAIKKLYTSWVFSTPHRLEPSLVCVCKERGEELYI